MTNSSFQGNIEKTVDKSTPWWPKQKEPKKDNPNVVLILLDDLGFSHLGCYGSDIHTPNIDKLAYKGLRYNNFHTTAICSPTRAALLTGRNPHSTGVSFVAHHDSGFPNGRSKVSNETGLLSEILVEKGYSTFAVGKWHLTPGNEQSNVGPFNNWPLGRGFEHYYGFLEGATSQWYPDLVEDNRRVKQPKSPEEGYHLTEDLTDKAIHYIKDQKSAAPDKPFFCYLAYGATHAPHHAPKEYIDRYKGKYDKGWDQVREEWFNRQKELGIIPENTVLPPRNPDVPAWDSLTAEQKKLFARLQEAFAGFLEHTDVHIGRLISFLEEIDQLDNTVVVLLSDNGACAMGREEGAVNNWSESVAQQKESFENKLNRIHEIGSHLADNHYPKGWASIGNTPLKWYKSFVHAGGVKDPLIIHYPKGIKKSGEIRSQYHHVIDIVPTILNLLEIEPPKTIKGVQQKDIQGIDMSYTFNNPTQPTSKEVQHFEMIGNRAIWYKGWKAVAIHKADTSFEEDEWELYHVDKDFSESDNLADKYPDKLKELVNLWWKEAAKYDVFPLDGRSLANKLMDVKKHKRAIQGPIQRVFYPTSTRFHSSLAPDLRNKSFEIVIDLDRASEKEEGVLLAQGNQAGGYTLFIKNNYFNFEYNYDGVVRYLLTSTQLLTEGRQNLKFRFIRINDNEGIGQLFINDVPVGISEIKHTDSLGFSRGVLQIGQNEQSPVSKQYSSPFIYEGCINKVTYFIGNYAEDLEASLNLELATE